MVDNIKVINMVQLDLFGRAPEVIIDIHEVSGEKENAVKVFIRMLSERNIYFKIEKLPVGDIIFPAGYAIERKTMRDLVNSLSGSKDGRLRLFEQIKALANTYEHPILLLEGGLAVTLDPINKCIHIPIHKKKIGERLWIWTTEQINIHPNSYESLLREIENLGVKIIKSFDSQHAAFLLMGLLESIRKNVAKYSPREKYAFVRAKPKMKTLLDQQLFFLSGLPGINASRAKKILEIYHTPYNAIMKINRWDVDVEGIGEKILERVKKLLNTHYKKAEKANPV